MTINDQILILLSKFLNDNPRIFKEKDIKEVMEAGVNHETAFKLLLLNYLGIDDKVIEHEYFDKMLHLLNVNDYYDNPYNKRIGFINKRLGKWDLRKTKYHPYELFVMDDFKYEDDKVIPMLGFFNKPFYYQAVYHDDRLWMSTTPNEINTMKEAIENSNGKVLTFGLGLGYFQYMCHLRDTVESVTIIEKDKEVIDLFTKTILPKFDFKDKINIINIDAYEYMLKINDGDFDYIFVDIYHDASDGKITYLKMNSYFKDFKKTKVDYWIYKTIKYYL